jgi:hypothetical protein
VGISDSFSEKLSKVISCDLCGLLLIYFGYFGLMIFGVVFPLFSADCAWASLWIIFWLGFGVSGLVCGFSVQIVCVCVCVSVKPCFGLWI